MGKAVPLPSGKVPLTVPSASLGQRLSSISYSPALADADQPIAVLQYTPPDLPLLVDEDACKPLGCGQLGRVLVLGPDYDALFLVGQVLDPIPPRIEMLAHFGHHFGMLANGVLLLHGIGGQVVQFAVLEKTPAFPKHRCLIGPHLGLRVRGRVIREPRHPAIIDDEDAVIRYLLLAPENGSQIHAVEGDLFPRLDLAKIQQGGQNVLNLGQTTEVAWFPQASFGPTDKAGYTVSALPDLGLLAPHPGIEILRPKQAAVVRFENQNGVFGQALVIEELHQLAHVPVDVADHPQVKAEPIFETTVQMIELGIGEHLGNRLAVLILRPEGPVGSVGRDIAKERFFLFRPIPK